MKSKSLKTAAAEITVKGVNAKLTVALQSVFTKKDMAPATQADPTLAATCAVQFYQSFEGAQVISVPPFGMPEALFTLEGKELILGFDVDQLPGEGIKEKIHNVEGMDAAPAIELIKKIGFLRWAEAGTAVVVPAGVLLVILPMTAEAHGLRWTLTGDKKGLEKAFKIWKEYCEAFPAYQTRQSKEMIAKFQGFIDAAAA